MTASPAQTLFMLVAVLGATAVGAEDLRLTVPAGPAPEACTSIADGAEVASVAFRQTFRDDFDAFDPYAGPWTPHFDHNSPSDWRARTLAGNGEVQLYVDPRYRGAGPGPLGLSGHDAGGGLLRLTTRPAPEAARAALHGYRFTSGMISSRRSFLQRHGYFEIRARLPEGQGTWAAFWMLAPDGWPPEIDVLEFRGGAPDTLALRLHWSEAGEHRKAGCDIAARAAGTEFRSYGLLWQPDRFVYYRDRRPVAWVAMKPGFDRPMYLLANLALGGWGGPVDPAALPAEMAIDWIGAWAQVE